MTNQEVVETVVNHLFEQGCRAGFAETKDDEDGGTYEDFTCLYRDDKGRMCAAGKMIRNEDYKPGMEGTSIGFVIEQHGLDYLAPHEAVLKRLQQDVHDMTYPWESTDAMKKHIRMALEDIPDIDLSFMSGLSFADR